MGKRTGPIGFPHWTDTVGSMRASQDGRGHNDVKVSCTVCKESRPVDLDALCAAKGEDFSLRDRRAKCRLTADCIGWNRFHYQSGVMRPFWTDKQSEIWDDLDRNTPAANAAHRITVANIMGIDFIMKSPPPPGIDRALWNGAQSTERYRLLRMAKG